MENFTGKVISPRGDKQEWWVNEKRHRECDRPAVITRNSQEWYKNGKYHREGDMPAVISGGRQEWWLNGQLYIKRLSISSWIVLKQKELHLKN